MVTEVWFIKIHTDFKCLAQALTQLKKVPACGSFMYDNVRYRVISKFPYIILYEFTPHDTISVYRVFNTSQNPFWVNDNP